MENTITLQFEEDGIPANIFSVKLASKNPSDGYGILDVTTQTAVVAHGTTVTPSPTGTYSYTFTVTNGHIYLVSWEIVTNEFESPVYKTDQIGPFFSTTNDDVRACATFSGKFIQGTRATFLLKITTFEGIPIGAENISISLYREEGILIDLSNTTPENVATGFYVYDWEIPDNQTIGDYTLIWNYTVDDIEKAEIQYFTVSADATDTLLYSGRFLEFRLALEYHLTCAQSIPVYYEQAKPSRDNKTFRFTFKNWNQSADVKIYKNGEIVNEGVEVDYFNGKIIFDEELAIQETVHADYNFKWFTDEELNRFLNNAVQTVNNFPPISDYSVEDVLDRFIPIVLYGATKDALRNLMMCLQFQQPQQVFGGSEGAQNAFSNFQTLKENYEKDWELLLEQKKYGPYPRSTIISVPEYSLPGGRSLSPKTTAFCSISEGFSKVENINVYTLEEIYKLFRAGLYIQILSQSNFSNNLIFSPVSYIWESGEKDVYELKTMNGYSIRSSDEHLFYVNGRYIPLRYIKTGDELITSDNHIYEISRVKSINKLRTKEKMLDLEVFGTKNLFANGIKCHNSRWFRMLFKG